MQQSPKTVGSRHNLFMPIAAHPTSAAATAVQQQLQIVEGGGGGGGARARPGPTEREQQQQSNSPIPTPRFVTRPMAGGLIRPELVRPSVTVAAQQPAQPGTGVYQVRFQFISQNAKWCSTCPFFKLELFPNMSEFPG